MTKKGRTIMTAMEKQYGKEKGKGVFHAAINAGKIKGAEMHKRKKGESNARIMEPSELRS
jgi:hypothetical protein